MKKIAALDFDGTLSKGYISMEFLDYLFNNKLCNPNIYQKQMNALDNYNSKNISYNDWCKEWGILWAQGLNGQSVSQISEAAETFFEGFKNNIYSSSPKLVSLLKEKGYETVILSTGAKEVVSLAADYLGAEKTYATRISVRDKTYSGRLLTDFHLPNGKRNFISKLKKTNIYSWDDSMGFGDSTHDIEVLDSVEIAVALNPQEILTNIAEKKHWQVFSHKDVVYNMNKLLF
ncbi:MAG: HAD-IB family phosphatase [Nanoarchaeota archaeon]|nr:HAD-IB family phosphatase [Nanoarchaeota archaeon]MBU1270502.1 HAD-IB family phosphatase [Nanoarchaeota archaeon]MBU1603902.1 HAD-IB family phosphatase [Nanoarchaeota archaeon]MBU2442660.1 HAD-IB family phosphatase [Nanoarchaeota archaeon]